MGHLQIFAHNSKRSLAFRQLHLSVAVSDCCGVCLYMCVVFFVVFVGCTRFSVFLVFLMCVHVYWRASDWLGTMGVFL